MNLAAGGVTATIGVPNAQTVVANSTGTELLVFSSDSDSVTVVTPQALNTGAPVTTTVPGFDRPVNAVFASDGTAYILNCGPQCGSASARDRKSTRLNSSHQIISYAVFCLKKKNSPENHLCVS